MKAASSPAQRSPDALLLVVGPAGDLTHAARSEIAGWFRAGDVVVANDAATMPASLTGTHEPTGEPVEVRLAGRDSLAYGDVRGFTAVVFGAGDHRVRTEDRPPPPALKVGDELTLGPLTGRVDRSLDHPRLVRVGFEGPASEVWSGIASHGRPIQYAHVHEPLAFWDVWTPFAGPPVAFEAPSAGFALDWAVLAELGRRRVRFVTLTHAAGISSTGDPGLDARLPLDEAYLIPPSTAKAIRRARRRDGRVIAIGTTATRALEDAARGADGIRAGSGIATRRLGPGSTLGVVDAVLTGVHHPGDSHYELLRAFAADDVLEKASAALEGGGYRSHEFGDSVLLHRGPAQSFSTAISTEPNTRSSAVLSSTW